MSTPEASGQPKVRSIDTSDLLDQVEMIQLRVGVWQHLGYEDPPTPDCATIPPLGERNADAIKSGHAAIENIDALTRRLYEIRSALVTQLRQDEDIRAERFDAKRGGLHRGPHDACTNPEFHYARTCMIPAGDTGWISGSMGTEGDKS